MREKMTEKEHFDIIFLRHGESVGNAESRWQGQADYPLTKKGRHQARALAERWLDEKRTFDIIISSPLSRASETAKIIAVALNLPLENDPIWAERYIGEVAGLTNKEVRQRFPERGFTNPYSAIIENEGEGDWELYLRAGRALQGLLRREPGKYLVVSHGGLLNQVMYAVVGTTPHANSSGPRFRFNNTGFAHLVYYPDSHRWQIDVINDRVHWNGKDLTEP
jgi:broad specificity phosphatase PhoE